MVLMFVMLAELGDEEPIEDCFVAVLELPWVTAPLMPDMLIAFPPTPTPIPPPPLLPPIPMPTPGVATPLPLEIACPGIPMPIPGMLILAFETDRVEPEHFCCEGIQKVPVGQLVLEFRMLLDLSATAPKETATRKNVHPIKEYVI